MDDLQKKFVEMGAAGFTTRLMKHFGDTDALVKQVQEVMDATEWLEGWATKCIRASEPHAPAFRFEEVPALWRQVAIYSMAVAFLMGQYQLGPRQEES